MKGNTRLCRFIPDNQPVVLKGISNTRDWMAVRIKQRRSETTVTERLGVVKKWTTGISGKLESVPENGVGSDIIVSVIRRRGLDIAQDFKRYGESLAPARNKLTASDDLRIGENVT